MAKDTALTENIYEENIEAPSQDRYYPDDYSTMIAAETDRWKISGEIPKTASLIIDSFNTAKRNAWASDESAETQLKANQFRLDRAESERLYELEKNHIITENGIKYESRKQELLADKSSGLTEAQAVQQAAQECEMPDDIRGIPEYERAWINTQDARVAQDMNVAMRNDAVTVERRAMADVEWIFNNYDPSADINCFEGFQNRVNAALPTLTHVSEANRRELFQKGFAITVANEATRIENCITDGAMSLEDGVTALAGLRAEAKKRKYTIKNKDGSTVDYYCYSDNLDDYLARKIKSLKSSSNADAASSDDALEAYKGRYEEFNAHYTPDEERQSFATTIYNIDNSSSTPSQKRKDRAEAMQLHGKFYPRQVIANYLAKHPENIDYLINLKKELDEHKRQGTHFDWAHYTVKNPIDGSDLDLQIPQEALASPDVPFDSYKYFLGLSEGADYLVEQIKEGGAGAVFKVADPSYGDTSAKLEALGDSTFLVKNADGSYGANSNSVAEGVKYLKSLSTKQHNRGVSNPDVSGDIGALWKATTQFSTPGQVIAGQEGVAEIAIKSGTVDSLIRFGEKSNSGVTRDSVYKAVALYRMKNSGDKPMHDKIVNAIASGKMTELVNALGKAKAVKGNELDTNLNKIYDSRGIAPNDRYFGETYKMINAVTYLEEGDKGLNNLKKDNGTVFTRVLDDAFVMGNKDDVAKYHFTHNIPVHSAALKEYRRSDGSINKEYLKQHADAISLECKRQCQELGISDFANHLSLGTNDNAQCISILTDGKPTASVLPGTGYNNVAGLIMNSSDMRHIPMRNRAVFAVKSTLYNEFIKNQPLANVAVRSGKLPAYKGLDTHGSLIVKLKELQDPAKCKKAILGYNNSVTKQNHGVQNVGNSRNSITTYGSTPTTSSINSSIARVGGKMDKATNKIKRKVRNIINEGKKK